MHNKYLIRLMQLCKLPLLFLIFFYISFGQTHPKLMTFDSTNNDDNTKEITITFIIPEKDFVYKDFISCSVYEPDVELSGWKSNKASINHYDATFKEAKQVFDETFSITMTATQKEYNPHTINLYCSYYRASEKKIGNAIFSFAFSQPLNTNIQINDAGIEPVQYMHHNTSISPQTTHLSPIHRCRCALISITQSVTSFFTTHHRKLFFGLILLMTLLFLLLYFYQQQLRKYTKLFEAIELIATLCVVTCTAYALKYFYTIGSPSIQLFIITLSIMLAAITGFFYIKKSTQLLSKSLCTFCTSIGMLCIIGALFLSFKGLQLADAHFLSPTLPCSVGGSVHDKNK